MENSLDCTGLDSTIKQDELGVCEVEMRGAISDSETTEIAGSLLLQTNCVIFLIEEASSFNAEGPLCKSFVMFWLIGRGLSGKQALLR